MMIRKTHYRSYNEISEKIHQDFILPVIEQSNKNKLDAKIIIQKLMQFLFSRKEMSSVIPKEELTEAFGEQIIKFTDLKDKLLNIYDLYFDVNYQKTVFPDNTNFGIKFAIHEAFFNYLNPLPQLVVRSNKINCNQNVSGLQTANVFKVPGDITANIYLNLTEKNRAALRQTCKFFNNFSREFENSMPNVFYYVDELFYDKRHFIHRNDKKGIQQSINNFATMHINTRSHIVRNILYKLADATRPTYKVTQQHLIESFEMQEDDKSFLDYLDEFQYPRKDRRPKIFFSLFQALMHGIANESNANSTIVIWSVIYKGNLLQKLKFDSEEMLECTNKGFNFVSVLKEDLIPLVGVQIQAGDLGDYVSLIEVDYRKYQHDRQNQSSTPKLKS